MIVVKIVMVVLTYLISLGVIAASNFKAVNLITRRGYTIKNGDKDALYNELNKYSFNLTRIMSFFPVTNIMSACFEGIMNILLLDQIIEDSLNDGILDYMNKEEREYFDKYNQSIDASLKIVEAREEEFEDKNTYELEKREVSKLCNNKYEGSFNKVVHSTLDIKYKKCLLEILKFCIVNNIDNLEMNKLIASIISNDRLVDPYYIDLYYLESCLDKDSMVSVITGCNQIVNNEKIDLEKKILLLEKIHDSVMASIVKKNMDTVIDIKIDNKNIDDSIISVESKKRKKQKDI